MAKSRPAFCCSSQAPPKTMENPGRECEPFEPLPDAPDGLAERHALLEVGGDVEHALSVDVLDSIRVGPRLSSRRTTADTLIILLPAFAPRCRSGPATSNGPPAGA